MTHSILGCLFIALTGILWGLILGYSYTWEQSLPLYRAKQPSCEAARGRGEGEWRGCEEDESKNEGGRRLGE